MKKINLEEILKSKIPKDCIWEEMNNLTNTPISLVLEVMREACNQTVDLCLENAELIEAHKMSICEECGGEELNNYSILKTKDQII
jgi:hypothetical protein